MTVDPKPRPAPKSSSTTKVLIGITLLGALVFVGSIGAVAYVVSKEDAGEVKSGSFLRMTLSGAIPTAPPPPDLFGDPSEVKPTGTELARALHKAATDDRIDGLYLRLDGPSLGWGNAKEIRDGIVAFRDAGKPCVAYSEIWTTGSWYVGSACDHVVMPPGGVSMVMGMDARTTYYIGTFEKLGIASEMLHVGDFKSAVEPYERSGPSEPAAEAMNYLLDGIWDEFIADASASRGITPEELQSRIDQPSLSPKRNLASGMVDVLAYPDVFSGLLAGAGDEDWREQVDAAMEAVGTSETEDDEDADDGFTSMTEYVKGLRSEWRGMDNQIAVIYAAGPITSGDSEGGLFGGQSLTDQGFRKWIRSAASDDDVKAIVLRVESPGGSGMASDMMWREIRKVQEIDGKPVVVSMGDYAASGGYYIAAPADWIVAQSTTLTGSIGVFGGKINLGGAYEKMGLTQHSYKRGAQSDLLASTVPFSVEGRAAYQGFLDDFYELFLERVTEGRGMDRDAVHAIAQGRVWTGNQALERGLVDEIGGLGVALDKAAELAEIDDYGVSAWPKQKSFFEMLAEDLEGNAFAPTINVQAPIADEVLSDLLLLESIMADGAVAMLPGRLTIE